MSKDCIERVWKGGRKGWWERKRGFARGTTEIAPLGNSVWAGWMRQGDDRYMGLCHSLCIFIPKDFSDVFLGHHNWHGTCIVTSSIEASPFCWEWDWEIWRSRIIFSWSNNLVIFREKTSTSCGQGIIKCNSSLQQSKVNSNSFHFLIWKVGSFVELHFIFMFKWWNWELDLKTTATWI